MKKCSKCGSGAFAIFGQNYCLRCGGEMIEEKIKYFCSNESCTKHIDKLDFPRAAKYCGECGAVITPINYMEE